MVSEESSVLKGVLCLLGAAIPVIILQRWWEQLRVSAPDTTRLYLYVLGSVIGLGGLCVDLASIT